MMVHLPFNIPSVPEPANYIFLARADLYKIRAFNEQAGPSAWDG